MSNFNDAGSAELRSSWPRRERRTTASHARLRAADLAEEWANFLGGVGWAWFATLTFDPKRRFPVGKDEAATEVTRWCGEVERYLRHPIAWVAALEQTRSGQWHVHVLLAGIERSLEPLEGLWKGRNGLVDVRPVTDPFQLVAYITKAAGANGDILLGEGLRRHVGQLNARRFDTPKSGTENV